MRIIKMLRQRLHREDIYSRAEFWDEKAREYDGSAISMWPNKSLNTLLHQDQVALIDRFMPDLRGRRVLELGCGTGRITCVLAEKGAHVVGVDYSREAVAIAERATAPLGVTLRVQSVFEINEDAYFDEVVAVSCLALACRNMDDLRAALTRCRKATVAEGGILLIEPFHRGFLHRTLNAGLVEVLSALRDAGYNVASVYHLAFWPTRLLLAFISWPEWFTTAFYRCGEAILRLVLRNRMGGDYIAIRAFAV